KMMLEELQTLRLGLITGRVSKDNLKHLEFLVKNRMDQAIVDDQLRDILSDIETRVAVELEKLKKRSA
ncbi:MAG: flagellar assembly protein FliX, partial [Alphaproteobacteria bacterium]|nr:flagellar assembly protein FliX [Alphaproteobacteria bacterium]